MVALNAVRKAIESLYKGECTVKEFKSVTDPITRITTKKEVTVLENQKCRLSYEKIASATQTTAPATIAQSIKLFIAPEIVINPGSKIIVTQHGKTTEFKQSGEPALYTNHQEIRLELFKEYA